MKVALVETQDLTRSKAWSSPDDTFSNRVSSLTPASRTFLEGIGAWQELDHDRVQPYQEMQVWDGISGARIEFDWQEPGGQDQTIAYMAENANLVRALLRRLDALGGHTTIDSTRVSSISLGPSDPAPSNDFADLSEWPHVTLSDNRTLAARLLVGADGPNSPVRAFADVPSRGWDYDQHGVVATLRLAEPPDASIAYQRFLPTGTAALLPLPGPYATLVWATTPARAALLKSLSPPDFAAMVTAAFRLRTVDLDYMHNISAGQADELAWRLPHTPTPAVGAQIPHEIVGVQPGSVASFPLRFRHADAYTAPRVALAGDAAHSVHPLAGQGLNMGLGDAAALARNLEYAVAHGADIGDQISLEGYAAERYEPNHRLMGVVDKLQKLYSWTAAPVVGVRSLGLQAVNAVPMVKSFLMRQAAG